jgi:hypothetical protein
VVRIHVAFVAARGGNHASGNAYCLQNK